MNKIGLTELQHKFLNICQIITFSLIYAYKSVIKTSTYVVSVYFLSSSFCNNLLNCIIHLVILECNTSGILPEHRKIIVLNWTHIILKRNFKAVEGTHLRFACTVYWIKLKVSCGLEVDPLRCASMCHCCELWMLSGDTCWTEESMPAASQCSHFIWDQFSWPHLSRGLLFNHMMQQHQQIS